MQLQGHLAYLIGLCLGPQAFMALEQYWPAVQSGMRAVDLDPDWPDGHLTLARAQRNYGEVTPYSMVPDPGLHP